MSNLSVAEFQQVFPDIYERHTVEVILETAKLPEPLPGVTRIWALGVNQL